ncbi:MAG: hypothetical protein JOY51_07090, partial [Nevskia sp.]|nr:hypothetical protein [Nevskia sp.]
RRAYHGRLAYVAHGREELARFACWPLLDIAGMTLYEPLGDPSSPGAAAARQAELLRELRAFTRAQHKPLWIAELGVRSAAEAQYRPWESPEQRAAPVDTAMQAQVLARWLQLLDRPWIQGVLVWCWYSDPAAGGDQDSDFTVQHKPAEEVLRERWLVRESSARR